MMFAGKDGEAMHMLGVPRSWSPISISIYVERGLIDFLWFLEYLFSPRFKLDKPSVKSVKRAIQERHLCKGTTCHWIIIHRLKDQ